MKALITSCFVVFVIALTNVTPSFSQNSEQLFQKAHMKEEGEGNLNEAIVIYTQIAEDSTAERDIRAKALLQIGICYEKLGGAQASKAYEKIITQYSDQLKTAEIARTRLQRINSPITQQESTVTKNPISTQIPLHREVDWSYRSQVNFDFSPDGKKFVYEGISDESERKSRPRKALFIADVDGSPVSYLIDDSEFLLECFPRYSPDGKLIAFVGTSRSEIPGEGFIAAIYAVNAEGGKPKQISKKIENKNRPLSLIWHPDSEHISYPIAEGITTINLSGGIIDTLSIDVDGTVQLSEYSPDGKWISAFAFTTDPFYRSDCFLVSATGGEPVWLTQSSGFDGYGTWSGKDYSFYFISNRNGDPDIFRIKIDPDTGEKIGNAEQITHYSEAVVFSPRMIKDKSVLAYAQVIFTNNIIVPQSENFDTYKTIAYGAYATLSPDGSTIFFTGSAKKNDGIFSIPRLGGEKKRLTDLPPSRGNYTWGYCTLSPDGSTLAFFTNIKDDFQELCFLSTEDGKLHRSITVETVESVEPDWSPDSRKITYACNGGLFTIPVWRNKAEKLSEMKYWEPGSIRWSPDGRYIAGSCIMDGEEGYAIVIVSTENGDIQRLTDKEDKERKDRIEWHPGSKKLAYVDWGKRTTGHGLKLAFVDGRPATEFIDQSYVTEARGIWDPSGENFYFKGIHRSKWILLKYNSATDSTSIFSDLPHPKLPGWNADGKFMILRSTKYERQLWIMENFEQ